MKKILLLALLCTTSACYRTNYVDISAPAGSASVPSDVSRWQNFFVWGLVPGTVLIDAAAACPGAEVVSVRTEKTAPQVIMNLFVPTIAYAPWTGKVHCSR